MAEKDYRTMAVESIVKAYTDLYASWNGFMDKNFRPITPISVEVLSTISDQYEILKDDIENTLLKMNGKSFGIDAFVIQRLQAQIHMDFIGQHMAELAQQKGMLELATSRIEPMESAKDMSMDQVVSQGLWVNKPGVLIPYISHEESPVILQDLTIENPRVQEFLAFYSEKAEVARKAMYYPPLSNIFPMANANYEKATEFLRDAMKQISLKKISDPNCQISNNELKRIMNIKAQYYVDIENQKEQNRETERANENRAQVRQNNRTNQQITVSQPQVQVEQQPKATHADLSAAVAARQAERAKAEAVVDPTEANSIVYAAQQEAQRILEEANKKAESIRREQAEALNPLNPQNAQPTIVEEQPILENLAPQTSLSPEDVLKQMFEGDMPMPEQTIETPVQAQTVAERPTVEMDFDALGAQFNELSEGFGNISMSEQPQVEETTTQEVNSESPIVEEEEILDNSKDNILNMANLQVKEQFDRMMQLLKNKNEDAIAYFSEKTVTEYMQDDKKFDATFNCEGQNYRIVPLFGENDTVIGIGVSDMNGTQIGEVDSAVLSTLNEERNKVAEVQELSDGRSNRAISGTNPTKSAIPKGKAEYAKNQADAVKSKRQEMIHEVVASREEQQRVG